MKQKCQTIFEVGWCFILHVDGINFALYRPATQSSTLRDFVASKAVDGITNDGSSISHTAVSGDYHPWWKVELAYPVWVTHVEIINRLAFGKQNAEKQLRKMDSFL